jgi:hypothetical protein
VHLFLKLNFLPQSAIMTGSRAIVPVLVGMMLLTGVCNTLLTKYQVRVERLNNMLQLLTTQPAGHAMYI